MAMNDEIKTGIGDTQPDQSSCDPSLSRAEFIRKVVKGAALTGGLLAAPKILDRFLTPPAYASSSSGGACTGPLGSCTFNGAAAPCPAGPTTNDSIQNTGASLDVSCDTFDFASGASLCTSDSFAGGINCA